MKKILSVIAGSLLFISVSVFAEEHLNAALEHANAAVAEGHAGSAPKLTIHAKAALDHSLAASLVAKSVSKIILMLHLSLCSRLLTMQH